MTTLLWPFFGYPKQFKVDSYFKKESSTATIVASQPFFNRENLHQVVSQRDCQDWYSRYIKHGVELDEATHNRNAREVLVKSFGVDRTWKHCRRCFTAVSQSTESIPRKLSFNKQHNCAENIANQEHFRQRTLGSYRVDYSRDWVVVNEGKNCVAKHSG